MRKTLHPFVVAAGLLGLLPGAAQAQSSASLEYAVKAAYLTKFIPFINWPDAALASATSPISICIMGDDPFNGGLERAASGAKAGERAITVRHVLEAEGSCQLVFLGLSDAAAITGALESLRGKPVVTVTDSKSAARGVISFVIAGNHVRFDIDDALAAEGGLNVSSKLLGLARTVRQRGRP